MSAAGEVDIVKVIGDRIALRKRGASLKGLCPFHGEKTPSLSVDPVKGLYHCFGCQAGGDAIDFVMRYDGLSFRKAVEVLGGDVATLKRREHKPVETAPVVDVRPFLAEFWEVARLAPFRDESVAYLLSRGVEPDAAWVCGCRNWSSRDREIKALISATESDVLESVGFGRDGKLWAPLEHLADAPWAGIAVPVWRIGEAFPWRWRWRFISRPYPDAPKSMSCYSAGSATDFLGAGKPLRLDDEVRGSDFGEIVGYETLNVSRAHLGSGVEGAKTLLVVEGEPDWWSATEAVDGRAVVVAVCGAPTSWRSAWPSLASFRAHGVEHVIVCVHEGASTASGEPGHGVRFAEDLAVHAQAVGLTVRARLPAEGRDLNDLHRARELRAWLDEVIA